MNLNIVNNLTPVLATNTVADSNYWWWIFVWALAFFVLGFLVGLFFLRKLWGNAFSIEEDNRRMHAAFKKREQAYLENRKNVSSIIGQQETDIRR